MPVSGVTLWVVAVRIAERLACQSLTSHERRLAETMRRLDVTWGPHLAFGVIRKLYRGWKPFVSGHFGSDLTCCLEQRK